MARKRPIASDVQQILVCLDGRLPNADMLTRAEAAALRRSAPLTHAALAEHLKAFTQATPGLRGGDPRVGDP